MLGCKLDFEDIVISSQKRMWPFLMVSIGCHLLFAGVWFVDRMGVPYQVESYSVEFLRPQEERSSIAQQKRRVNPPSLDKSESILKTEKRAEEISGNASTSSQGQSNSLVLRSGNPNPPYPPYAQENGIEGKVQITVSVDVKGEVEDIKVSSLKAHPLLEKSVVETVRQWKFEPIKTTLTSKYEFIFKLEV